MPVFVGAHCAECFVTASKELEIVYRIVEGARVRDRISGFLISAGIFEKRAVCER